MKLKLNEADCAEIHSALRTKLDEVLRGRFNREDPTLGSPDFGALAQAKHLAEVIQKIGPEGTNLAKLLKSK